jgi:hypothetical protein
VGVVVMRRLLFTLLFVPAVTAAVVWLMLQIDRPWGEVAAMAGAVLAYAGLHEFAGRRAPPSPEAWDGVCDWSDPHH